MRNRLNLDNSPQFGDKYFGHCKHCGCHFEFTIMTSKFCSDSCRWKQNNMKKKNDFFKECHTYGIPLSRIWMQWAHNTILKEIVDANSVNEKSISLESSEHIYKLISILEIPDLKSLDLKSMKKVIRLLLNRSAIFIK